MSHANDKSQAEPSAPSGVGLPPVIRDWGQQLAAAIGESWDDAEWPEPSSAPSIFDDEEDEAVAAALRADLAKLAGPDGRSRPDGTIAREDAEITDAVRGIEANIAGWKLATANKAIAALGTLLGQTREWAVRRAEMRAEVRAANARLATVQDIPDSVLQPLLAKHAAVLAAIDDRGGLDWEVESDIIEFGTAVDAAAAMQRKRSRMREAVRQADARLAGELDVPDAERGPLQRERDQALAAIDRAGGVDLAVDDQVAAFDQAVVRALASATKRAELRAAVQAAGERMAAERGLRDDERGPLQERRDTMLAVIARDGGREAGVDAEVAAFVKAVDSAIAQAKAGVFVGAGGVAPIRVAASNFDGVYEQAMAVLNNLAAQGWRFRDEQELIAYVGRQPTVKAAQEAAAAERERLAAERAAAERERQRVREARASTPVVFTFDRDDPLRNVLEVRQYDIAQGTWRQLTTQSAEAEDRGRNRKADDFELATAIDGVTISFHVHGPKFSKGEPTPGAFMADGRNPKSKQVPREIMDAIVRLKGRPKVWDT